MNELQKKNDADLVKHVAEKREELRKLRFSTSGSSLRDVKAQRNVKKEIARSLTLLTQRSKEVAKDNNA